MLSPSMCWTSLSHKMPRTPPEEKRIVTADGEPAHVAHVRAPARLHLGFLDLHGGLGRKYGGVGLAVDRPETEITLARAREFSASGAEPGRALHLTRSFSRALGLAGAYSAGVRRAIPAHAGLGSGTQLALAIGAGMLALEGRPRPSEALGALAERGARSAIGMAAFDEGGFIVDGGRGADDTPPPVLVRLPFPETWRVLLVLDNRAEGVHGDREAQAFAALRPFPESLAGHLCRLVLMRLLPGLVEEDIAAFGAAIAEIQAIAGAHFAPEQGGSPWSSPAVGRLVQKLGDGGAVGLGQSSWGPTGFAFAQSEDAARPLYEKAAGAAKAEGLEILIARGRNTGARVELLATADLDT